MRTFTVAFVAVLISFVNAQNLTCSPFNAASYTGTVCKTPTYNVNTTTPSLAVDAENALATLKANQNPSSFVSETCITAYLQLICAQAFPTCDPNAFDNVTVGACVSLCQNIWAGPNSCNSTEINTINSVATTAKIPTLLGCNTQYPSPQEVCTREVDVSVNTTDVEQSCITVVYPSRERFFNDSIFIPVAQYQNFTFFQNTITSATLMLRYLLGEPNPATHIGHDRVNQSCLEAYELYFNALLVPACPNAPAADYVAPKPCVDLCTNIVEECGDYDLVNVVQNQWGVVVPGVSTRDCQLNSAFASTNCYLPTLSDVGVYYADASSDTPTPGPGDTPTPSPIDFSNSTDTSSSDGPHEEWAKGGILGGGLLVAIFAVIGGLMLLMKRQDSR